MTDEYLKDVQPLGRALRQAGAAIEALMECRIEEAGISFGQLRALHAVCEGMATTPGAIAEAMALSTGSATRLIDSLERSGWLTRERRKDDRRVIELKVTDDGRAMVRTVAPIVFRAWREVLDGLDATGIGILKAYLSDITCLADELRMTGQRD